jgi:hypothetical protein
MFRIMRFKLQDIIMWDMLSHMLSEEGTVCLGQSYLHNNFNIS